ncbi:MAG TPA: DUF4142 domain-containing protein [Phycisphaerae bacterium]|nr:DUF4142 domain-containing protein [Phycisphaerae bacterium]
MRYTMGIVVLCAALAPLGCQSTNSANAGGNNGQQANGERSEQQGIAPATAADQRFFDQAGAGGMYEVEAGQLALQKSSDTQVRNIAQRMVTDHTKANDELMSLARSEGVALNAAPTADQQQMLKQLQGMQGSDFDREYLRQQKTAHEQTIALFQGATQNTSQPVRMWASKTLPTLREHLAMINGDMNGMNNMGSNR